MDVKADNTGDSGHTSDSGHIANVGNSGNQGNSGHIDNVGNSGKAGGREDVTRCRRSPDNGAGAQGMARLV